MPRHDGSSGCFGLGPRAFGGVGFMMIGKLKLELAKGLCKIMCWRSIVPPVGKFIGKAEGLIDSFGLTFQVLLRYLVFISRYSTRRSGRSFDGQC